MAVAEGNVLTMDCVPDKGFFQSGRTNSDVNQERIQAKTTITAEMAFILEAISQINQSFERCGREKLSNMTQGTPYAMSPSQMRNRLEKLERMGLIIKRKGRHGTVLTAEGESTLMEFNGDH